MQWWNDVLTWLTATSSRPVLLSAAALVLAVILGALVAALISRTTIRRLLHHRDREMSSAAVAALIDAATEASIWNSLPASEQLANDRAVSRADIQLRLLPVQGSQVAADWAGHQLARMKRDSATFGYRIEPVVTEFRERLVEWRARPRRARKEFLQDLERWRDSTDTEERTLAAEQDAWVAQQHHDAQSPTSGSSRGPGPHTEAHQLIRDVAALDTRRDSAPSPDPLPTPVPAYGHSNAAAGSTSASTGSTAAQRPS